MTTTTHLDDFLSGYVECALWASIDEQPDGNGGPPMDDKYGPDDIAPEALESMRAACAAFMEANAADIESYALAIDARNWQRGQFHGASGPDGGYAYAGHAFWLTRNGHGAGFWDRGLGGLGERLSESARAYGEAYLYAGDDGKVYAE